MRPQRDECRFGCPTIGRDGCRNRWRGLSGVKVKSLEMERSLGLGVGAIASWQEFCNGGCNRGKEMGPRRIET